MAATMAPEQAELGLATEHETKDKAARMRGAGIRPPSGRSPVLRWDKVEKRSWLRALFVRLKRRFTA